MENEPLDLEGRSKAAIVGGELLVRDVNALDLFEALKPSLGSLGVHGSENLGVQLWVRNNVVESIDIEGIDFLSNAQPRSELGKSDGFGDDDTDEMVTERITIDEDGSEDTNGAVHVLDLLERDVFTLRQLHDVLHAINDRDAA